MTYVINLRRHDTSTPWGFRMDGGVEFGRPLFIQKVTKNSIAEKSGIHIGDGILQIGHIPTQGMTHDNAKMEIIRSGNEVDFVIQRNAVTVCPPQYETTDQTDLTQDLVIVHSPWKGGYAQNPNVQSRSFKILQQQLSSEAQ